MYPDHDIFTAPDFTGVSFKGSRTTILFHDDFLKHKTGPIHPENPNRLIVMRSAILEHPVNERVTWLEPDLCDPDDIMRCHTRTLHDSIERASEHASEVPSGIVWLDPDTAVCPDTYRAARRAVGAVCRGVDLILANDYDTVWALVRPPGHHATSERSMGFCLFNNAACAAAYARAVHNIKKVMIIDYDLHHGNGTQEIFYSDPGVLYTSIHQSYHYPGSGYIGEIGQGEGRGYTVNFPVLAHSGDNEFALYFREIVAPIALQFKPQLIIISVGFDAHTIDPLGSLQVTTQMYGKIVTFLRALGSILGIGILFTLEGGYSLEAQAESVIESLVASTTEKFDHGDLPMPNRPGQSAMDGMEHLREYLTGIWEI